jgi:hypothetical protein
MLRDDPFIGKYKETVEKEIRAMAGAIVDRNFDTLEEYKYYVGLTAGLRVALQLIETSFDREMELEEDFD